MNDGFESETVRRPKSADIDDERFLTIVDELSHDGLWGDRRPRWVMRWEVASLLPEFPQKVVYAKAARLIRRGLMHGCPCGCRGDYHRASTCVWGPHC